MVDMFCFEADYATKYVKSDYVADMGALGIDQSKQYKYTKDIVTNAAGKLVGSSWQATPGIIAYNTTVAKAVFGDSISLEDMGTKLNTWDEYQKTAKAVHDKGNGTDGKPLYYMNIGTDDWFRVYQNNLSSKMYVNGEITIDKQLFQWVKDTKKFVEDGYVVSTADNYGLWGEEWGKEQGRNRALCVFSCPWFTDFCLTGNVKPDVKDGNYGDLGYKAVKGYKSWFWGGTWLTATKKAVENEAIKDTVKDIIAKMTTDTDLLTNLAKKYGDFTNDEAAMNALANSADGNSTLFGGQNVYKIYAESVKSADLSNASDFDQQICENIQNKFRPFFQDSSKADQTAEACLAAYLKALGEATSLRYEDDAKDATKKKQIHVSSKVTIEGNTITIAD